MSKIYYFKVFFIKHDNMVADTRWVLMCHILISC
jgi:hypothetical protein